MAFAQLAASASGAQGTGTTSHVITMPAGTSRTLTLVTNNSRESVHAAYRITGHSVTALAISSAGAGSGTAPNPPSLTSGFGAVDALWLAFCALNAGAVTGYPTDYTLGQLAPSSGSGGANDANLGVAARELNAATEDPGAFTSGSDFWGARTIAVEPGAAGGSRILVFFNVNDNPNTTTITNPGGDWTTLANTKVSTFECVYWIGYADDAAAGGASVGSESEAGAPMIVQAQRPNVSVFARSMAKAARKAIGGFRPKGNLWLPEAYAR